MITNDPDAILSNEPDNPSDQSTHQLGFYWPRLIDARLGDELRHSAAIWVRGPKWCGKTSTCSQVARSALMLRNPDVYNRSIEAARVQPSLLLRGDRPRLLDEWQIAPTLWDAVVYAVDQAKGAAGQFLLTGSATPIDPSATLHTGTGRITRLPMTTMTLSEAKRSSCDVSLKGMLGITSTQVPGSQTGEQATSSSPSPSGSGAVTPYDSPTREVAGVSTLSIEDYATFICQGGWPSNISLGDTGNQTALGYVDALCETDLSQATESRIDSQKVRALLRSLARNTAQDASLVTLRQDVEQWGVGMSEPTLRLYLNALRQLFVLQEVTAWAPKLRSKAPLRVAPVWHLCDPSLAAAALGVNAEGLLDDLNTMGYLFESLCVHDLRVYAQLLSGDVFRYRDKSGLEIDAIVRLPNGTWGACEVKLGGEDRIEQGAAHLAALAHKVDAEAMGAPAFLAVITGGTYAYTREDGVHVVPIGCLTA